MHDRIKSIVIPEIRISASVNWILSGILFVIFSLNFCISGYINFVNKTVITPHKKEFSKVILPFKLYLLSA